MGRYLVRRLLIAIPSLIGISVVLFTVLALAPGDPFEELATNPNVPAAVRCGVLGNICLDDPIATKYPSSVTTMLRHRLSLSFVSRTDLDLVVPAHLPNT